jgi:hypothetical protein
VARKADSKKRQDDLICAVVGKFMPTFAPGGIVLYRDGQSDIQARPDDVARRELGIDDLESYKAPDVIVYHAAKNRLILIDAVPGHGPVNAKRHKELAHRFMEARPHLFFVTAFLNRSAMAKHISEISWATEVWTADAESHLIHFNGDRLLGPYEDTQGSNHYAQ